MTEINDEISIAVQNQYEENPYPRWTKLPSKINNKFLNAYIHSKFPKSLFNRLEDDLNPKILIAGCGTGQHPIGTYQIIKGANILAIDLSLSSLAYAKRKTNELQIHNINYAQADLLKLKQNNAKYDLIESSGVLHHLENPFVGWEILLSLLKLNGLMKLGFYSELARRDIVKVRNFIKSNNIDSSPKSIRDYRHKLLLNQNYENFGFSTTSADFFTTSSCRDLLFHVQEHRLTLKEINNFLTLHGLRFLGFEVDRSVIQKFRIKFPSDSGATNLMNWDLFENENPDTFFGMYQFWIQKNTE